MFIFTISRMVGFFCLLLLVSAIVTFITSYSTTYDLTENYASTASKEVLNAVMSTVLLLAALVFGSLRVKAMAIVIELVCMSALAYKSYDMYDDTSGRAQRCIIGENYEAAAECILKIKF